MQDFDPKSLSLWGFFTCLLDMWPNSFLSTLKNASKLGLGLLVALGSAWASAQSLPDPSDELLRQQERQRQLREAQEAQNAVRLPSMALKGLEARLPLDERPCVPIHHIALVGSSATQFQWVLRHAHFTSTGEEDWATGRCLGSEGIGLVMRRMQNALIGKGYSLAQVLAGPQAHLQDQGRLELTLFEGRIRDIAFSSESNPRGRLDAAMPVKAGDVFHLRAIEQALENFQRVPTVQANIELKPAEGPDAQPGETDVLVHWQQSARPFRISLFADDGGTRATGKYQGGVTLSYDHALTLNDVLYLTYNHDLGHSGTGQGAYGTHGYNLYYAMPVGYWQWSLNTSQNRYHQSVAGLSENYLYSGISRNHELKLQRLLHRNAQHKTTLGAYAWSRASRNYIDDTEVQVQRRRMAGWGLNLAHRQYLGQSTLDLQADYRQGTGARRALPAPEEAFGEGRSRPRFFTASAQIQRPFALGQQHLQYSGLWRAQWNRTPLVPQDRFAIGGRYTVRGFDGEQQLSSERGWLLRQDLSMAIGQQRRHALYLGLDYGRVGGPSQRLLLGRALAGAAVGVRGSQSGVSYDLFVAKPISKPSGFKTAYGLAGFSASWSF